MFRLPVVAALCAVCSISIFAEEATPTPAAEGTTPAAEGTTPAAAGAAASWTNDQKASYLIGQNIAQSLKPFAKDLDTEIILSSIRDALNDKESVVPEAQARQIMQAFQAGMQAKEQQRAAARKDDNAKWLAENGKKEGVTTTASGLQYQVINAGAGKQAAMGTTVTVHYTGTLLNGTKFDSSVDRGEPADFPLNPGGLIQGWLEALPMMKEGDKWKLFIPSELAYGEPGNQGIPPNSLLIFEVELIKVTGGNDAGPGIQLK